MKRFILFLGIVLVIAGIIALNLKEYQKVRLGLLLAPKSSIAERVLAVKMLLKN